MVLFQSLTNAALIYKAFKVKNPGCRTDGILGTFCHLEGTPVQSGATKLCRYCRQHETKRWSEKGITECHQSDWALVWSSPDGGVETGVGGCCVTSTSDVAGRRDAGAMKWVMWEQPTLVMYAKVLGAQKTTVQKKSKNPNPCLPNHTHKHTNQLLDGQFTCLKSLLAAHFKLCII